MMRTLLLVALFVTALFFYINSNSEIDTIEGESNNSTKLETKDMVVNQDEVGMAVAEMAPEEKAASLIKDEFDMVMPTASQPLVSPNEYLAGGIDDIGGYYDVNARSPESESQQYNDITSIGIDASDVLTPEMDFDYIDTEGSSPSINKGSVSSEPPEKDNE
jgi:hypothetical protein